MASFKILGLVTLWIVLVSTAINGLLIHENTMEKERVNTKVKLTEKRIEGMSPFLQNSAISPSLQDTSVVTEANLTTNTQPVSQVKKQVSSSRAKEYRREEEGGDDD